MFFAKVEIGFVCSFFRSQESEGQVLLIFTTEDTEDTEGRFNFEFLILDFKLGLKFSCFMGEHIGSPLRGGGDWRGEMGWGWAVSWFWMAS